MDRYLYEREYLRLHSRNLTQADLRITLVLTVLSLIALNVFL